MKAVFTGEGTLRALVAEEIERALRPVFKALAHQDAEQGCELPTLLTKGEVATLLRVNARTLRRMVLAGEVPAPISIGDRTDRWRRQTIEKFLKARENAAQGGKRARL